MNEIEILKDLVSINTIKDKDNNQFINYIEKYLNNLGFKTIYKSKLLVMKYGDGKGVTFIGHSDTVELTSGWHTDPFTLIEKNNKLYGLGVCDMKGGIAAFLQAIKETKLSALTSSITVVITYDEEIGFSGIEEYIKYYKTDSKLSIVGEPTNNEYWTGCKGMYALEFKTKGIKVHASNPARGKSAIDLMLKILDELTKYYKKYIVKEIYNIYDVNYTTMCITKLNGGSAKNSVAQDCTSYVDFRICDSKHIKMLQNKLNKLCKKYSDFSYYEDVNIKPFANDITYLSKQANAYFMTEASFLTNKRVILGPGPVTAHEIDEHITVQSLNKCVKQYQELIIKNCFSKED